MDPHLKCCFSTKATKLSNKKTSQWKKERLSWTGTTGEPYEKNQLWLPPHIIYKNYFKVDVDLNVKAKAINLLERKRVECLHSNSKDFLNRTQKLIDIKEKEMMIMNQNL